ncbi:NUDIX hydrolase [Sinorhizobium americanum]|uniref:NUDIX domain-containing protein n=1 Tax=Sinorhizobium americanum TaxID=194963 RepID=A0A4R2BZA5_9HYPH|nr:NUDIX hydrolase [Sinorhizobium americanum]TCN33347.1 NUDIX domain-containing protein [Sinorhizobium americanum]
MTKKKKQHPRDEVTLRRQVAVLPFRVPALGSIEILLITSRDTGRFIIPKGWRKKGQKQWDSAAREALEEAGVVGEVSSKAAGSYTYWKRGDGEFELLQVLVYPLEVKTQRASWPEKGERKMAWLTAEDAALLVDEPALASLIRTFAPKV